MANGKITLGKQSGGTLGLVFPDGVSNTEVVLPESGNIASVDTVVTDNALARYDGTTGKLQNSGVIVDDNNNIIIKGSAGTGLFISKSDNSNTLSAFGDKAQIVGGAKDTTTCIYSGIGIPIAINIGSTEVARIDSSGKLLVGQTGTGTPPTSTADIYAGGLFINPSRRTAANAASAYWEASTGAFYRSTSSLRYKTNIQEYKRGLQDVMKLRPVSFNPKDGNKADRTFAGFIAEEVDALGINEFVEYDANGLPDSVAYAQITALLTKAIQEQQAQIETLTAKVAALEAK